jgi:hypothetical protein
MPLTATRSLSLGTDSGDPLADPLGQLDDDPRRAADVTEPVDVFVALHLADELGTASSQAGDDGVSASFALPDERTLRGRC